MEKRQIMEGKTSAKHPYVVFRQEQFRMLLVVIF